MEWVPYLSLTALRYTVKYVLKAGTVGLPYGIQKNYKRKKSKVKTVRYGKARTLYSVNLESVLEQ